jgi:hypothetical protein
MLDCGQLSRGERKRRKRRCTCPVWTQPSLPFGQESRYAWVLLPSGRLGRVEVLGAAECPQHRSNGTPRTP